MAILAGLPEAAPGSPSPMRHRWRDTDCASVPLPEGRAIRDCGAARQAGPDACDCLSGGRRPVGRDIKYKYIIPDRCLKER
ncbi:MAG: hypothetical protein ACYDHX_01375 [Methanothrix sp.]